MKVLAINPWIYDFAAYDFWLKPYGFLVILSYLKKKGVEVEFLDFLDNKITRDSFGRGKFYSEIIHKPDVYKAIPRYFKRYGKPLKEVERLIANKRSDFILITSSMTYWYPAVNDAVNMLKQCIGPTPIILGGTYATLCLEHAQKNINCDYVFKNTQLKDFFEVLKVEYEPEELYSCLPSYEDFCKKLDYVVFRTSWGCPLACSYCANKKLFEGFVRIPQERIVEFIRKYYDKGIRDFVFYDEALLYENEYIINLLKEITKLKLDVRFHTPNALHIRFLNKEIAHLLKASGFVNPHFGLETLNDRLQRLWGDKVNKEDVVRGIKLLKQAGFKGGQFSMYLLLGYPGQDLSSLKEEADFLHSRGSKVSLAEFSPTPETEMFKEYKDKFSEPLLHNNSIFSLFPDDKLDKFYKIKNYVRNLNKQF